jgi:hypothetical protein
MPGSLQTVMLVEQVIVHGGAPCGARAATVRTPPAEVSWIKASTFVGPAAETRPMKKEDCPAQTGVAKVKVTVLPS